MKLQRIIGLAAVLFSMPLVVWGQSAALEPIRKSATASEAVSAYANAIASATDKTLAQQAFVNRMIDLHSPQLAAEQAKEVTLYVNDGQAWAVMAYTDAQQDRIDLALEKILKAVKYSPSNDFVQRTAGQILAWYDVRDDRAALPEAVQVSAEQLRAAASRGRVFGLAYDEAKRILTEGLPEEMAQTTKVNVVGSLEELGTYSGYTTSNVPGLASYWGSPYLYPGYGVGSYWTDYAYPSRWAFPPVRLRDVSPSLRYLTLPGYRGYVLVDGFAAAYVPDYYPAYYGGFPGYVGYAPTGGYRNRVFSRGGNRFNSRSYPGGPYIVGSSFGPVWPQGTAFGNFGSSWGPGISYDYFASQRFNGGIGVSQMPQRNGGAFGPSVNPLGGGGMGGGGMGGRGGGGRGR